MSVGDFDIFGEDFYFGFIYFKTKIFVTVLNSTIFSHFILMESFKNYSIKAILAINSKRNSKSLLNIIRHLIIIQILQFVRNGKQLDFLLLFDLKIKFLSDLGKGFFWTIFRSLIDD
jgi:hypothetical protein